MGQRREGTIMAGRIATKYPGVVYWERTHAGKDDRYYGLRYRVDRVLREEKVGWASDGWTAKRCDVIMRQLRENHSTGTGPQTLREMREQADKQRDAPAATRPIVEPSPYTLGAWLTEVYIPSRKGKKSERTVLKDEGRAVLLAAMPIGGLPLAAITPDDVSSMLDDLRDAGRRDGTLYQYYALVRHAFNQAMRTFVDGAPVHPGDNPCAAVDFRPDPNARHRFFSRQQIEEIMKHLASQGHEDARDAALLSLHTGLRLDEISRLQLVDVDTVHGQLYVRAKATNKPGGMVPLNATAREMLERRAALARDYRVFPPLWGERAGDTLSRHFRHAVNELGYNDGVTDISQRLVFHSLRHTFGSWLALAGVDIYRIKTLMRHKTISMTMRYAHLLPDATRDAVNVLDDHS